MSAGGQAAFVAALLDPATAPPGTLRTPEGAPATRRFDVYRNNVAASLTEALETAFPVVRRLVGAEFFSAMAGLYLRQHPPTTPLTMFYGAEMPGFLAGFPPVAHLPYLPDVARLELALRDSYHAADRAPIAPDRLGTMAPDALEGARLTLAPALRLVRSEHPLHGIWLANMQADAPRPGKAAESALVTRPGWDPAVDPLDPAGATFVAALEAGRPLGVAAAEADGADLPALLSLLLSRNAIVEVT